MDAFYDGTINLRIVLPYPYILRRDFSVVLKGISFKTDRYKYKPFRRAGTAIPVLSFTSKIPRMRRIDRQERPFPSEWFGLRMQEDSPASRY